MNSPPTINKSPIAISSFSFPVSGFTLKRADQKIQQA